MSHSQVPSQTAVCLDRSVPSLSTFVRRTAHTLGLVAATLTGLAATTSSANAQGTVGLARVGPVDPSNGFPLFYEDASGLRLGLCTNPNVCFFLAPNPTAPVAFPANWPDEAFYYAANASMSGVGGARALLVTALEAAFVNGAVAPGEQMVFTRVRVRMSGLIAGATYTISHPWGSQQEVADAFGTIFATSDVGAGQAGAFGVAVGGGVGPFVTPVGFLPGAPAGTFISDGATETTVQGSPLGQNYFRVSGPNIASLFPANAVGANTAQIDTFVIQGQVATALGASVDKATYSRTVDQTAANVWATTASAQALTASADGSPPVQMAEIGSSGVYFARVTLPAGSAQPASVAVSNLTDAPSTTFTSTVIHDELIVTSARYTVGGDLVVQAVSGDEVGNPILTATAEGLAPAVLVNAGAGVAAGPMGMTAGAAPPRRVTVTSAAGGTAVADLSIRGVGTPGGIAPPLVANAGIDQVVAAGAPVALSGIASTGNIASFAWTHDAGTAIALLGAGSSTPSFTAPNLAPGTTQVIAFTLTIADALGNVASDTALVTVAGPIAVPDVVTMQDGRFDTRRNFWRASGVVRLLQGQRVTLYVGATGNRSRPIATVTANALGAWTYVGANNSAVTQGSIPTAADTTIWAESALGGTPGQFTFRRQ